jgi:hypothetical protein
VNSSESGMGCDVIGSVQPGHRVPLLAGLGLSGCFQHLGGPIFLWYHGFHGSSNRDTTEKTRPSSYGEGHADYGAHSAKGALGA